MMKEIPKTKTTRAPVDPDPQGNDIKFYSEPNVQKKKCAHIKWCKRRFPHIWRPLDPRSPGGETGWDALFRLFD